MASTRIGKEAYDRARRAAAIFGESAVEYLTRITLERAEADILEDARRTIEGQAKAKPEGPGGKPKRGA